MEKQDGLLSFSEALSLLKEGVKVCRLGWNGKGMWVVLIRDWTVCISHVSDVVGLLPVPFIAMKTASEDFVPWLASQSDLMADDWVIFE